MAGLTLLSSVKWGQMVSESRASAYQGTRPVPPDRQTAHGFGQGYTKWAGCAVGAQGTQAQQLMTTGGGRHIWLKTVLFRPAEADQTTLLILLPSYPVARRFDPPSLNREGLQRVKGRRDPTEHHVRASGALSSGALTSHGNTNRAAAAKRRAPQMPTPWSHPPPVADGQRWQHIYALTPSTTGPNSAWSGQAASPECRWVDALEVCLSPAPPPAPVSQVLENTEESSGLTDESPICYLDTSIMRQYARTSKLQ